MNKIGLVVLPLLFGWQLAAAETQSYNFAEMEQNGQGISNLNELNNAAVSFGDASVFSGYNDAGGQTIGGAAFNAGETLSIDFHDPVSHFSASFSDLYELVGVWTVNGQRAGNVGDLAPGIITASVYNQTGDALPTGGRPLQGITGDALSYATGTEVLDLLVSRVVFSFDALAMGNFIGKYDGGIVRDAVPTVLTAFAFTSVADQPTSPVPEPETYAMMIVGLGLLVFLYNRRINQAGTAYPSR